MEMLRKKRTQNENAEKIQHFIWKDESENLQSIFDGIIDYDEILFKKSPTNNENQIKNEIENLKNYNKKEDKEIINFPEKRKFKLNSKSNQYQFGLLDEDGKEFSKKNKEGNYDILHNTEFNDRKIIQNVNSLIYTSENQIIKKCCSLCKKCFNFDSENNDYFLQIDKEPIDLKRTISCSDCKNPFHIGCLIGTNDNLSGIKEEVHDITYLYDKNEFFCPFCLIKKLFPLKDLKLNNIVNGPCLLIKNSDQKDFYRNSKKKGSDIKKDEKVNFLRLKLDLDKQRFINNNNKTYCLFVTSLINIYPRFKKNPKEFKYSYFYEANDPFFKYSKKINVNFLREEENFSRKRSKEIVLGRIEDITDQIKQMQKGQFYIEFNLKNSHDNILVFFICEYEKINLKKFIKIKTDFFKEKLTNPDNLKIQRYKELKFLMENNKDDLNSIKREIITTKFKSGFDFKCPFSKSILKIPVKGKYCNHLDCFELENFMIYCEKIKNRCPICKKFIFIDDLIIGSYLYDKLKDFIKKKGNSEDKLSEFCEYVDIIQLIKLNIGKNDLDIKLEIEQWEYEEEIKENSDLLRSDNISLKNENSDEKFEDFQLKDINEFQKNAINFVKQDEDGQDYFRNYQMNKQNFQNFNYFNNEEIEFNSNSIKNENNTFDININFNFDENMANKIKNYDQDPNTKNIDINLSKFCVKNSNNIKKKTYYLRRDSKHKIDDGLKEKRNNNSKDKLDKNFILSQEEDESSMERFIELQKKTFNGSYKLREIKEFFMKHHIIKSEVLELNDFYFFKLLFIHKFFEINGIPFSEKNLNYFSNFDFFRLCQSRYDEFHFFFRMFDLKYSNRNFKFEDLCYFIYLIDENVRDLFLLIEIILSFSYYFYLKQKEKLNIIYIVGNMLGCFYRDWGLNILDLCKINKKLQLFSKTFHFDECFSLYIMNKIKYENLFADSLMIFVTEMNYFYTIYDKVEFFSKNFNPIIKVIQLIKHLEELKKPINIDTPNNLFLIMFAIYFLSKFFDMMNFSRIEIERFFILWDKRGFFLYLLYKFDLLHLFSILLNLEHSKIEILEIDYLNDESLLNKELSFIELFIFYDKC